MRKVARSLTPVTYGRPLAISLLLVLLAPLSYATIQYSGSLASDYTSGNSYVADGLLSGSGAWVIDTGDARWKPALLEWDVTQASLGDPWQYHYKLTVYKGAVSHFIVETSSTFTGSDIYDDTGSPNYSSMDVGMHYPPGEGPGGPAQPGMPDPIYGIKFDGFSSPPGDPIIEWAEVWFTSGRAPIWGDFYAKDGNAGDLGINALWNAGLVDNDTDPADSAGDGSVSNHLLVPDTFDDHEVIPSVPEPVTSGLFLLSVLGGFSAWRRRK